MAVEVTKQLGGESEALKSARHQVELGGNGRDAQTHRVRPTLQAAALGSPFFQESWCAGAPLNWVEFVERGRVTRSSGLLTDKVDGEP